jgi:two-component system cell cycle response regulator CtrA
MRMLLVEDDRTFSRGMVAMLGKSGIQVEVADTGEEALERAALASFDLVLLDLMLPDMDGHEVLRRLRAAQVETPVMVLSGLTGPQARVKAFHLGGDEFLAKPFDREELLARIHAVVRRCKTMVRPRLSVGPLSIDLESQKVTVNGHDVPLTGREYGILELLALRKGTVLAKEAFMTHLYGGMDEPEIKIIDVFICKLRRKLATAGAEAVIGTIWGRGYVLRDPMMAPDGPLAAPFPAHAA